MNKSKIEWCDYTINPIKGLCPMACSYCYARRMYKRFKWDETVRFENFDYWPSFPVGSKVFVGSTMELFGNWIKPEWLKEILAECSYQPAANFIFLTKQPQNLPNEFPDNCWVGVSVTDERMFASSMFYLIAVEAKVKFVSFEPLLSHIDKMLLQNVLPALDWVIVGQQTPVNQETKPEVEWVDEIINAVDKGHIPVFLKNNLDSLLPRYWDTAQNLRNSDGTLRQEFPV